MELLIIAAVVVVGYFMVVHGLNLVGAAKETGKVVARGVAEVPNATRWVAEEAKLQNKEYKVQVETMGDEYKASYKEAYTKQRRESNVRYKDAFKAQKTRHAELDKAMADLNIK